MSTQPNKHIMAFITFVALVPLVYFIPELIAGFLPAIKWVNVVVAVGIIVPIISYLVMPFALWVFRRQANMSLARTLPESPSKTGNTGGL